MALEGVVDIQKKRNETAFIDFIITKRGQFVLCSSDEQFTNVLDSTIVKYTKETPSNHVTRLSDPLQLDNVLSSLSKNNEKIFLFIEFFLFGREMTSLIRELKRDFPKVYIVVLLKNSERGHVEQIRAHDINSTIVKPISEESMIEKIALLLLPENKIAQLFKLTRRFYEQREYNKSMELVQQILLIKPNSAAGLMLLGDIYKQLGNIEDAKKEYEVAYSSSKMFVSPLHKLIEIAEYTNDKNDQLKYLLALDAIAPDNIDHKISIGILSFDAGDLEKAEASFSTALDNATQDAYLKISELSQHIATIYTEKYPEKATAYLQKAIESKLNYLKPSDIVLFNELGICLRKQGRWEEAIENYKQALTIAPTEAGLHYNMAMAYSEGKHFGEACEFLRNTIKYNPHFPLFSSTIACNFASIFMRGNCNEEAKEWFNATLKIDPENYVAKKSLETL